MERATSFRRKNSGILILADKNAMGYYLLRARYALSPCSVNIFGRLANELKPGCLDFVIFFGKPGSIAEVPDWKPSWQKFLVKIEHGKWVAL